MKAKIWLANFLIIVISVLSVLGYGVYKLDPFFHYRKPDLEKYYYTLNNQRSQNDGICKHFDYDTLITGTSMTENFRTSEADEMFGCNSIKVPYSGGSYKEINDNIERALIANPNLKMIIRCLDMDNFFDSSNKMRLDLGEYPIYLYDDNLFNDVEYLLNRDVIFGRVYQMILDSKKEGGQTGITSFDDYSRWQESYVFGINAVSPEGVTNESMEQVHLTDEEKEIIKQNISLNVINIAEKYPDVEFYYFYSPYSVVLWNKWKTRGKLYKVLEAEEYITKLIVPHKNIHLFSFNTRTDITTDLNNYKDNGHYATWINSLILKWMRDEQYRLTEDNCEDYLKEVYEFYTTFDYTSINGQEDYEADFYAAALLNEELTGITPLNVLNSDNIVSVKNGEECIKDEEICSISFDVDLDEGYNYLYFEGQKITDSGMLVVYVYNSKGEIVEKKEINYSDFDNEIHQYVIDLSNVRGEINVVLNSGFIDSVEGFKSDYHFCEIYMY